MDDPGCMARAVMEGVLIDLYRYNQQMGTSSQNYMIGAGNGLGKSRVWPQIAADMFNRKHLVVDTENTVYGAALLAGSRHPEHKDLRKAAGKIAYSNFEPDKINAALYREITGAYK